MPLIMEMMKPKEMKFTFLPSSEREMLLVEPTLEFSDPRSPVKSQETNKVIYIYINRKVGDMV